jgi:hypothetical protein
MDELLTEEHHRNLHGRCAHLQAEVDRLRDKLTKVNQQFGEQYRDKVEEVERLREERDQYKLWWEQETT